MEGIEELRVLKEVSCPKECLGVRQCHGDVTFPCEAPGSTSISARLQTDDDRKHDEADDRSPRIAPTMPMTSPIPIWNFVSSFPRSSPEPDAWASQGGQCRVLLDGRTPGGCLRTSSDVDPAVNLVGHPLSSQPGPERLCAFRTATPVRGRCGHQRARAVGSEHLYAVTRTLVRRAGAEDDHVPHRRHP